MQTLMRLLLSRATILLLAVAGLGFASITWVATRPPDWQAWAGEASITVQAAGVAPAPQRVRLRGGDAGLEHRGTVQGDRLRFGGLTPDTPYVLEWRAGPFVPATLTVRTLPPLLPLVDLEVKPGAGELAVRPRIRDPRLAGVDLCIAHGSAALARQDDWFVIPLPAPDASIELGLLLPGTMEVHPLDLPVLGGDRLLSELTRAESDLEPLLKDDKSPALVEMSALEKWEPVPLPARRLEAPGGPGLLARLRRLAPLVRATAAGSGPLPTRWKLALATSRLAAAEVLARKHQQPNLGVLDWTCDMVRFSHFDERRQRGRNLLRHPAHLVHRSFEGTAAASLVNVVGGTPNSKSLPELELPPLLLPVNSPWIGLSFVLEAIFNSGPPLLSFPRAGVAVELPLVQRPPSDKTASFHARTFPVSTVDVWFKHQPADADWSFALLEATYRSRSGRESPTYVRTVRLNTGDPPRR